MEKQPVWARTEGLQLCGHAEYISECIRRGRNKGFNAGVEGNWLDRRGKLQSHRAPLVTHSSTSCGKVCSHRAQSYIWTQRWLTVKKWKSTHFRPSFTFTLLFWHTATPLGSKFHDPQTLPLQRHPIKFIWIYFLTSKSKSACSSNLGARYYRRLLGPIKTHASSTTWCLMSHTKLDHNFPPHWILKYPQPMMKN